MPVLLLLMTPQLLAQARTITGTVRSAADDSPLIGVSILIKGTSTGAITDIDGMYEIDASDEDVLVFSYMGY